MTRHHSHPCSTCPGFVPCDGEWERNHDGFPEVICGLYHLPNGATAELICEDCRDRGEREQQVIRDERRAEEGITS